MTPIEPFDYNTLNLYHERLCLDFTNTAGNHSDPNANHLNTYADLIAWSQHVGILDDSAGEYLLRIAARCSQEADTAFQKALIVREAIYEILSNIADGRTAKGADLNILNGALSEAMAHMRMVSTERGFAWEQAGGADDLERMLWPVAWSAAELLMSDDLKHVRECAGKDCDWLFLDTSRNHSRRWCSMDDCGNRAKARRHYQRARKTPSA